MFDALKVNDVVHSLVGRGLWSSSLLDFSAVIPYNPDNAIQVYINIYIYILFIYNYHG